jgi:putative sterol carrier protein
MKIILLYSASTDHSLGLERIVKIAVDVLTELGLTIKEIDLYACKLPYFNLKSNEQIEKIIKDIRDSYGVILASTSRLPIVPAPLSVFLEYLTLPEYSNVLKKKNCLLLIASENGGERSTLDSLSRALQSLGAYDCIKTGLQRDDINKIGSLEEYRGVFERLMEDYYRIIRQSRQFFIPLDYPRAEPAAVAQIQNEQNTEVNNSDNETKQKLSINDLNKKLNLDKLNENQTEDINEITEYFNKIISEHQLTDNSSPIYVKSLNREMIGDSENQSSCKTLTQSLPHHFQPQHSHSLNAVIQLHVRGEETFVGFITIRNTECAYSEGTSLNPDISIITDASIWRDVCMGKYSAQKAFMIGRLKVRGNFVLLTKFDHLFRLDK